jgi:predicted metal-binding membrane protein
LIERALRRDRAIVIAALVAVVVLAWVQLLLSMTDTRSVAPIGPDMTSSAQVAPMPGMHATPGVQAMPGLAMPATATSSASHAIELGAMWAVMMGAMMLPGAAPMILFYTKIAGERSTRHNGAGTSGLFALGYLVVWFAFSAVAVLLQLSFERYALVSPAMRTTSAVLAGIVLAAARVYQLTPAKRACLRQCRSPLAFVLGHWRPGARGAFVMGLTHGTYCVGCCGLLMLLLFVGGVMNVAWIGAIALYVLVEKTVPAGHWLSRAAGVVLILWGAATLVGHL